MTDNVVRTCDVAANHSINNNLTALIGAAMYYESWLPGEYASAAVIRRTENAHPKLLIFLSSLSDQSIFPTQLFLHSLLRIPQDFNEDIALPLC